MYALYADLNLRHVLNVGLFIHALSVHMRFYENQKVRRKNRMEKNLRDYFAAKAMQAILTRTGGLEIKHLAKHCYDIADEMIKFHFRDNS